MSRHSPSLRGEGWWYRRDRPRWFRIHDHCIDACSHPARFGLDGSRLEQLVAPLGAPSREEVRDQVIPWICAQGFIRVRSFPQGHLGWQFHGDPDASLLVLRRFVLRHGIGRAEVVNFTDFATRSGIQTTIGQLLDRRSGRPSPSLQESAP